MPELPSRAAMHSPESVVERTPKGAALALIGRAYRDGRLVDREATDQWFLICKHHGARQLSDPSLVDRCNVWWWMNQAHGAAGAADEPPCVFVDAVMGVRDD